MPSPIADQPGLLLRDPLGYTERILIVPPPLVPLLRFFDGSASELDLRVELARQTDELDVRELARHFVAAFAEGGFLRNQAFDAMRERAERAFADGDVREPSHTGSGGYPGEPGPLRAALDGYLAVAEQPPADAAPQDGVFAIAAPHVSPEGGFRCYAAAYRALPREAAGRCFVVLGTSHYGPPERFGLTRKPFRTPYGDARVDLALLERLERAAPGAVTREDYCHKVEHSIEFQVVFLQHLLGPELTILPILVGPFARSLRETEPPEADDGVRRFLDALAELQAREASRLFWILGIDMAHVGRRYGDRAPARAGSGPLQDVAARDHARIDRALAGDAGGFWELVQRDADPLRWCGAAPLYAFLRAAAPGRGRLLRYEQWNIDPASVVSFAGIGFAP